MILPLTKEQYDKANAIAKFRISSLPQEYEGEFYVSFSFHPRVAFKTNTIDESEQLRAEVVSVWEYGVEEIFERTKGFYTMHNRKQILESL
jgi:hypothetical protein